jgi:hypothetical protein
MTCTGYIQRPPGGPRPHKKRPPRPKPSKPIPKKSARAFEVDQMDLELSSTDIEANVIGWLGVDEARKRCGR